MWLDGAAQSKEAVFAKESVALLFQRDLDALSSRMAPELRTQVTPDVLAKILAEVPAGAPDESRLVGYNSFVSARLTQAFVSLQYRFPAAYLLAQIQVTSSGGEPSITSLHVQRLPASLQDLNAFRFAGKSPRHFVVLALAILVPLLIVLALVLCARTPLPRRKLVRLLFVSLGFGKISLNWTTGAIGFSPLSFQLLGAGFVAASSYAPWILSVSMPVGAILFLVRRRHFRGERPLTEHLGVEQAATADKALL
jgi:hypothetical protein